MERNAAGGARAYRIVNPLDGTGRMTVRSPAGDERTVVDCLDQIVESRLAGLSSGERVRLELTPTGEGSGHVAARVLPGNGPVA